MGKFVKMIVDKMTEEKLYAPQGGPIIIAQIENEYGMLQNAFKEHGHRYINWAADLAHSFNIGIPWMMCKQYDVPKGIISACNGRKCADINKSTRVADAPFVWAEDWTTQFRSFGDPPAQRGAEDIAYHAARFFAKNGSVINYYMYHGGTNFGRTAGGMVTTRYYDEAPLDEYGLLKEPKWGHMKDLHYILQLTSKTLLEGDYSIEQLAKRVEAMVYQIHGSDANCVAFISNNDLELAATVTFRGKKYLVPRASVSILPDCKTVAFNTAKVTSQHNSRSFIQSKEANAQNEWEMYNERIPKFKAMTIRNEKPMEQWNLTKDATDYMWYSTTFNLAPFDMPRKKQNYPIVRVTSHGHALTAFANGQYIGEGHGDKKERDFITSKPAPLKPGRNEVSFLNAAFGMPDGGGNQHAKVAGVHTAEIMGLNAGTIDLTRTRWAHKIGLIGENKKIFDEDNMGNVAWLPAEKDKQATWYKRYFTAPRGDDPVVVDMSTMSKGMFWVNGENIGRYWVSFHNDLGIPCQTQYHIPRVILKQKNLIVVFEEIGGDPSGIKFQNVKRDNVCSYVGTNYPSDVETWEAKEGEMPSSKLMKPQVKVACSKGKVIKTIAFADYGNPTGGCGEYLPGNCSNPLTKKVVETECLGKRSCSLDVDPEIYGADQSCPWTKNVLAVQVKCSRRARSDKQGKKGRHKRSNDVTDKNDL